VANISAGVYTKIVDLSTFVQAVPGTIGFICALTEKGEDNKIKFLGGQKEFVDEFGKPNISLYGNQFGQGSYVAYNYLGESGALYFMRCLPDDATYSNLRIYGNSDTTSVYFIDYVSDLNNSADITTAMQTWGNNTPLVIFYPIGRGSYYNNLGIEITEDVKRPGEGVYHLDIYETQSNGDYVMIESYTISFDESAVSLNPGESIFVEYVLETYSTVLRSKVSPDGFSLLEKVYYDTRLSGLGGAAVTRTGGPTGETSEYNYDGDISIVSSGQTSYIDQTTVTHVVVESGQFWATTSNLNSVMGGPGGFGNTSGAFNCGGRVAGISAVPTTRVEKWNGSTWATTTVMIRRREDHDGCGDPTNGGLIAGGYPYGDDYVDVDIWNGSTWATTTDANRQRQLGPRLVGSINDAIMVGGACTSYLDKNTELWDGSSWSTTSRMNSYHCFPAMFGDTTSCICAGGYTDLGYTAVPTTEKYYSTYPLLNTWSTTSDLNYSKSDMGGLGTTSDALCIGGGYVQNVSLWNGSSWATTTIISEGVGKMGTCGTTSAGLRFAGGKTAGAYSIITEIFDGATWSAQGNFPTWGYAMGSCGTTSDALGIGGGYYQYGGNYNNSGLVDVYKFNGSSWATTPDILTKKIYLRTCGTTSDAIQFGGGTAGSGQYSNICEVFNGSSWATTTVLPVGINNHNCSMNSSSTNLNSNGGNRSGPTLLSATYRWNGVVWSSEQSMNAGRNRHGGAGDAYNSAMVFGGAQDGNSTEIITPSIVEVFVWSTTSPLNAERKYMNGAGSTWNAGIAFGGLNSDGNMDTGTEKWDGSSWATTSAQNNGVYRMASCGTVTDALSMGGNTNPGDHTYRTDKTEIWYTTYATETHISHELIPVITDVYQLTDTVQDFSPYETDPEIGDSSYVIIVSDSNSNIIWAWLGDSTDSENHIVNVWKDRDLDTSERGWNGDVNVFDYNDLNLTYIIKRSYDVDGLGIPGLFSIKPLKKGSDGSLISSGSLNTTIAIQLLSQGYAGQIDEDVLNTDDKYFNLIYDAGYPKDVKDQIVGLSQSREDSIAIIDVGDNTDINSTITSRNNNYPYNTYYASLFSPYSKIFDIWTGRHVWFSPCYHMAYILPRNDHVGELWFSAAGNNRGVCRDIEELRYTPNRNQRDILYLDQINPIIHQNSSYVLWSQLTTQSKASVFQDLNVTRMVLYISTAIKQFANNFVFDQNNQLTWSSVKTNVTLFLEQVKKKRGLFGYSVDVGATEIEIKRKTFHLNIILEPIKITEKIELNFFIK